MKRSKMVALLSNFLYELNLTPDEAKREAESLLDLLESYGMNPPERIVSAFDEKHGYYNETSYTWDEE